MNELTLVLFLLTVGIFLASFYMRRVEVQWLGVFIAVCSIAISLVDETLQDDELTIMVIIPFFIMLMMGIRAYQNKG